MRAKVRNTLSGLILASSLGLGGCLEAPASLHPFFEGAGEPVPGIEGYWLDGSGDTGLEIRSEAPGAYELVVWEKGRPAATFDRLTLRFGQVGDDLFWDLSPKDLKPGSSLAVMPVHVPARIRLEGGALEVTFLDADAMGPALESGELTLSHTIVDDVLVLTGSTEELQAFLTDHGGRPELFDETITFHRRRMPRQG